MPVTQITSRSSHPAGGGQMLSPTHRHGLPNAREEASPREGPAASHIARPSARRRPTAVSPFALDGASAARAEASGGGRKMFRVMVQQVVNPT